MSEQSRLPILIAEEQLVINELILAKQGIDIMQGIMTVASLANPAIGVGALLALEEIEDNYDESLTNARAYQGYLRTRLAAMTARVTTGVGLSRVSGGFRDIIHKVLLTSTVVGGGNYTCDANADGSPVLQWANATEPLNGGPFTEWREDVRDMMPADVKAIFDDFMIGLLSNGNL